MVKKHGELKFEFSKITDGIYIGTNVCCKMHFDKSLLKRGIRADVSLEEGKLDNPFGVKYYLWLPTRDHCAPSMNQMLLGARFIYGLIENKEKVYVHCRRGHTRAPTLVAAYFVLTGLGVKDAIAKIKKKRPGIHVSSSQKKALEKFAKKYGGKDV